MKSVISAASILTMIIGAVLLSSPAFSQTTSTTQTATADVPFTPEIPLIPQLDPTDPSIPEPFVDSIATPMPLGSDGTPDATADIGRWTSSFTYGGRSYPFTMVGGNPLLVGTGTSTVPVMIVPLRVDFGSTPVTDPNSVACNDSGQSVLSRVQNSPLFTTDITWRQGTTNVGTTQYIDAFQRANFWKYVVTRSPNYHVLLNPTTMPLWVVPAATVHATQSAGVCPNHPLVVASKADLDNVVVPAIIQHYNIRPNTLLVVLAYDVEISLPSGFFVGYHAALSNGQTYVVSSYLDQGLFGLNLADVSVLSHELGEWMNDPLISNVVPTWGHVGQVTGCSGYLEVGDPLSFALAPVFSRGFNYHVEDLAFIPWFARINPSISVNGWFSMFTNLGAPKTGC